MDFSIFTSMQVFDKEGVICFKPIQYKNSWFLFSIVNFFILNQTHLQ